MITRRLLWLAAILSTGPSPGYSAPPLYVVSSDDQGMVVELRLPRPTLIRTEVSGQSYDDLEMPGSCRLSALGQPALPFFAELIAAPPGSRLQVTIEALNHVDLEGVRFVPAIADSTEDGAAADASSGWSGAGNAELAETELLGRLRGVEGHALRVFPVVYDGAHGRLRVYDHLRIHIRFSGGSAGKLSSRPAAAAATVLYHSFLNPDRARDFSRDRDFFRDRERANAKVSANLAAEEDWYDPDVPWIKLFLHRDGLYRVDAAWLEKREVDLSVLDPASLRILHLGVEQPIYVAGGSDGRFDSEDFVLFHGRYCRDDKDFESIYGRRNVYWLTWGGEDGWHMVDRSGAPVNDYPVQRAYWTTTHFEQDIAYDPFPSAPNNDRDHWMWTEDILATKPDVPSSRTFVVNLNSLETRTGYTARIRVALHGLGALGHHTVVQLNNTGLDDQVIDDRIWEGQTELLIETDIPASYLLRGKNRLLVKAFADQAKTDNMYLNWFEVDHLSLYQTVVGYLDFPQEASEGHRITVTGFKHPKVALFDLTSGGRLVDAELDTIGSEFGITFEDVASGPSHYVAADSLSILVPTGLRDTPSTLRPSQEGADYLIITHVRFAAAAERLAEHRRGDGLSVKVVDVDDIYDEFSHGLLTRSAVRDFVSHAYHNWDRPPVYLLLLGTTTFDHRNIEGFARPTFVPTQYYHARSRGHSPSDYFYALQDGDDLLPDLAVGRLLVESGAEADRIVERIVDYDLNPEPGDWRSRVVYAANHHESNFIGPSQALASTYTQPLGLEGRNVFNVDEAPLPNPTGVAFVEELNRGALLVNYAGHGSAGSMASMFGIDNPDWGYLGQVDNGRRLPIVVALSCNNGMFVHPRFLSLAEVFTSKEKGGAIAYISASATSFVAQNNLLGQHLFNAFFVRDQLQFGPTLNSAKASVLAARTSFDDVVLTMQLFGDPAQPLSLPRTPDYEPIVLAVEADPVFGHSSTPVAISLVNNGTLGADSIDVFVRLVDTAGVVDTVWSRRLPPFAGSREFSFDWPTLDNRGHHQLELEVDPKDEAVEGNEGNNLLQAEVELLEPLLPQPLFPPDGIVLEAGALVFKAVTPHQNPDAEVEFLLSADATGNAIDDGFPLQRVVANDGVATLSLDAALDDGDYCWKVRVATTAGIGPWSSLQTFAIGSGETVTWGQRGGQFLLGWGDNVKLEAEGLTVAAATRPFRPSEETREDGFTVRDLNGAGVLATDGTHLFAKRWYNDASTVYPGNDFFSRVGTGYNETRRDLKYGVLADSTTAGISATYHGDGYIYNDSGRAYELERIHVETGKLDTVAVADGLLEWQSGLVIEDDELFRGHSLITSDGRYIYNVAMSSEKGMRTEWSIRVFDPEDEWSLVRAFTSPPTANGFTYKWTDGLLADGERLYLIEHRGQRRIRMIDAFDGRFLDEWTSDQDLTRIITGQYDWVNNKVWLGDLHGSAIFRYTGLDHIRSGTLTSPIIGPTDAWHSLRIDAAGEGILVDVLVPDDGEAWRVLAPLTDLAPGAEIDLNVVDADRYPELRLRARFDGGDDGSGSSWLQSWTVEFDRLPSLELAAAQAGTDSIGLWVESVVRNLSAVAVTDARLTVMRSDSRRALAERALPELAAGATFVVRFDSLSLPPVGIDLVARVLTARADAVPADNERRVPLLFDGRAPILVKLWPEGHSYINGDPLRPGQGLIVSAPAVAGGRVTFMLDGKEAQPDSLLPADGVDAGPRVLLRPELADGTHELQARVWDGREEVGARTIRLVISSQLALANALVYPNPIREAAAITFTLSHDATVAVDLYALSGRRVRHLEARPLPAGFAQVAWDGRDDGGKPVANGTYLFRVDARSGDLRVESRGPLMVLR